MRRVIWSRSASEDLNELVAWIAQDSEPNAGLVLDRIERVAANLSDAAIGRFGRVEDTYEIVVPRTPYIIAYAKTDETIMILRVIHGARDWREGGWPADD